MLCLFGYISYRGDLAACVTLHQGTRLDMEVQRDRETNLAVLAHNPTETRVPSVSPCPFLLMLFSSLLLHQFSCSFPYTLPLTPRHHLHNCLALALALNPTGVTISSITLGSHSC